METGCDSILALQLHRHRGEHTVLKQTITYSSFVTETISTMSVQSATPTAAQPASTLTGKGVATAGAITQLGTTGNTTFGMPAGITLPQFDGTGWSNWSGILEALLALHEVEDVFTLTRAPLESMQQIGTPYKGGPRHTYAYMSSKMYIHSSPTTPSTQHSNINGTGLVPLMVVLQAVPPYSIFGSSSHKPDLTTPPLWPLSLPS